MAPYRMSLNNRCPKMKLACATSYNRGCRCKICRNYRHYDYLKKPLIHRRYIKTIRNRYYAFGKLCFWIKNQLPCKNCKKWFKAQIMQNDHIKPKLAQVRSKGGLVSFIAELIKTRILCANCHTLRTHQQRKNRWKL